MERTGLGTPATRAATIEKLVRSGFVERKKKKLTAKITVALLKNGRVRLAGLYSEKKDTTYAATIVLHDDGG